MTITPRQIQLIQESFKQVEPIADQAAEIFYNKLFEYDPALRPLFKSDLKDQGRKLMTTLKVAVNGLNDLDKLVVVLQQLAERHVGYGVKPEDYTPVGNALLFTLKTGLGPSWNPELRQAWVDVFRLMATVMKKHAYQ
ncbi:MAG: globin family protein [Candidatus Pelagadaptatus aseana]|uniref:globin family protein n=1 Tax=Candidatus Pelagadaptatus aseana TaxID=3120508 RepID=UPI0039B189F6